MTKETWPCPVRDRVVRAPDSPAVRSPDGDWTYRQFDARIAAAVSGLSRRGVGEGDRVAVFAAPSPAALAILLAAFRLGAAVCPLNLRMPNSSVPAAAERMCARLLISDDAHAPADPAACAVHELLGADPAVSNDAVIAPDRPAAVLMTSGSTGTPKAAVLTYRNLYRNAEASNRNIPLAQGDTWLLSLPLYHVSGLGVLFRCVMAGASVAIPAAGASLDYSMRQLCATHVSLVATQMQPLLDDEYGVAALSACKAVLLGGSALPETLIRDAHARGLPIYTSYGLTEMASQVTTTTPGAPVDELLTAGRPLTAGSIDIANDGEIRVRGETRFAGYWCEGELETPFDNDGWFATGDLGAWDDAGRLVVRGRKDNLIISGGENIQPEEVEAALLALPGVLRAAVLPVADAVYGQRPVAFVLTTSGDAGQAALREALAACMPKYKIPDHFYPWPEALRAREGKIPRDVWAEYLRGLQSGDQ